MLDGGPIFFRLSIQIYAKDGGQPQQSAYTVVKVRVLEANDHDPQISFRYLPDQVRTSNIDNSRTRTVDNY